MIPLLRRLCAWVALVTFSSLFVLPFTADGHLLAGDDPGCGDGPVLGNSLHPFTQIEPVRPPLVPEHCALCHALRTFSSAISSAIVAVPLAADLDAPALPVSDARVRTYASGRSSRAPPSIL